ncbi:MAG: YkvA family protein [Mangrovibacterium sp.]
MKEPKDVDYEEVLNEDGVEKYAKHYDEETFLDKVKAIAVKAGGTVIYAAILLYEVMRDDYIPMKTKAIIIAALGYLVLPFDIIPDIAPLLGFSDDLAVLIYAIAQVRELITPVIRGRAIEKVKELFPSLTEDELTKIQKTVL